MTKYLLFLAFLLAACGNEAPPPPTGEQAGQLDEAEAMLNALSANQDLAANEEGPADRSTGPSNSSN
jgi:hypothetical protein